MMALRAHTRGTFAELTWDLSWTTRDGRDRTPVFSQAFPLSEGRRAYGCGRQPRAPGKTAPTVR